MNIKKTFLAFFTFSILACRVQAFISIDAGADQSLSFVSASTSTTLFGSAVSTDPVFYVWQQISPSTPIAVIGSSSSATTAVTFTSSGTYLFRLFGDNGTDTSSDTVQVTVTQLINSSPTVNAGTDQSISVSTTTLNGNISDDGLLTSWTTAWVLLSGPGSANFTSSTSISPIITLTSTGSYIFQLRSSDGQFSSSDTVTINYSLSNSSPTVNAGTDQSISVATTTLNGNIVDDGLLTSWTTSWVLLSGPGSANFTSSTSISPTITLSSTGSYIFQLSSSDGQLSSSDTVTITYSISNATPTANAGSDQSTTAQNFTLDGSASTDDGLISPLTYAWAFISGPVTPTILSPTSAQTSVTATQTGTYVFQLTVNDGQLSDIDLVTVQLTAAAPTALSRDSVILRGSKNVVENGQPATIKFRLSSSGSTSLTIFGSGGRVIKRIIDQEYLSAGDHERTWDGDGAGSGTYKVRIEQDGRVLKDFYIVVNQ